MYDKTADLGKQPLAVLPDGEGLQSGYEGSLDGWLHSDGSLRLP